MRTRPFTAFALVTSMVLLVLVVSGGTSPTLAQAQPLAAAAAGLREAAGPASVSDRARVGEPLRSSPVMFIENVGQFDEGARFQVWGGPGGTMWLAEDALWITIVERSEVDPAQRLDMERADARGAEELRRGVNLRLSFPGANPTPCMEPFDRLDTVVSYFIGNDPAQWRPAVPVWAGVRYRDLYPGVDLELTGEDGQWAWRWVPQSPGLPLPGEGSGAGDLLLRVEGADEVTVESGQLRLATAVGERLLPLPALEGQSVARPTVVRLGEGGFEVAADVGAGSVSPVASHATASESMSLAYSGFLGGSSDDYGSDIAVDGAGNAYVTGHTWSSNFPAVVGPDLIYNGGSYDAFVAKVRADGTGLVYAGFLGGSWNELGLGIAVDGAGNAYVTGVAGLNFPAVVGPDLSFNGASVSLAGL